MKRIPAISVLCLLLSIVAFGTPKYWIGPSNGKWSDRANWSEVPNGTGGVELPGTQDSVIFTANNIAAIVHVDLSPTIRALRVEGNEGMVTLYASTDVTFTLLGSLTIPPYRTLKDSTSADVHFNFVFSGASQSQSTIRGRWVFEGGVPVTRSMGGGAGFTAEPGSHVTILSIGNAGFLNSGVIIFRNNTNSISSDASSLKFSADTKYILENNLNASIPNATWSDSLDFEGRPIVPSSSIRIIGSMEKLVHSATTPNYKDFFVEVYEQKTSAALDLPDGTVIQGNLSILSTNSHTIGLLAPTGPSSSVSVRIYRYNSRGVPLAGNLYINENAKVAMANATAASPATSYNLQVINFNQSGGYFSLQDYNDALGSSILAISGNLVQTAGTFLTNSTTTNPAAKFVVDMNGPVLSSLPCPCSPVSNGQYIRMAGKTIDNANHMVTLRMSHTQYSNPSYPDREGVDLQTPLQVGRLELLKGTLNTTDSSIITVADPGSLTAIKFGSTPDSYVNGPIRRFTNSAGSYPFPIGKGKIVSFTHMDSCLIFPVSAVPSLYQAEYFNARYGDSNVISPLKGVSTAGYWKIEKVSGSDARVQLVINSKVQGAAHSDAVVAARYINGHWGSEHGSVLTPGDSSAGSVTSKQLSDLGLFTFGYGDSANFRKDSVASLPPGLNYKYYQGFFSKLPNFNLLTPAKSGHSLFADISQRRSGVTDSFAFVWEGYITISTPGTYTFETVSDDGSKLYFNSMYSPDSIALVDNDGTHPPRSMTGTIDIPAAGRYPIAISFFENYGGEGIELYWSGPGFTRKRIQDEVFSADTSAIIFTDLNITTPQNQTEVPAGSLKTTAINKIYPNPFIESFTIDIFNDVNTNKFSVAVYDLRGLLVYTFQAGTLARGHINLKVNLPGARMANGVYLAKVAINGVPSKTVKLIKIKR